MSEFYRLTLVSRSRHRSPGLARRRMPFIMRRKMTNRPSTEPVLSLSKHQPEQRVLRNTHQPYAIRTGNPGNGNAGPSGTGVRATFITSASSP